MNELVAVFVILASLAIVYLWLYPKYAGDNIKRIVWMDLFLTPIPIGISALMFWESDPVFTLIFFETNWFFFTLIAMVVIELPILQLYLRARGLTKSFWNYALLGDTTKNGDGNWASASPKAVEKVLNDTKWDGLRTLGAKRFLFWGANTTLIFGTGFLAGVGDNAWAAYSLIHILLIFVFWYLLRQAVRLVADAPEEALDEMMLKKRNESYVIAFRWLAAIGFGLVSALMVFAVASDFQEDSNGFNYILSFTWPQVQALFWFFGGYAFMMPSLAMVSLELKKRKGN
jgi:hypothetical protein